MNVSEKVVLRRVRRDLDYIRRLNEQVRILLDAMEARDRSLRAPETILGPSGSLVLGSPWPSSPGAP